MAFCSGVLHHIVCFGSKADHQLRSLCATLADPRKNIWIFCKFQLGHDTILFFQFARLRCDNPPISHRRSTDRGIRWQRRLHRRGHLLRCLNRNYCNPVWCSDLCRARDKNHLTPKCRKRCGDRTALRARGPVGNIAHRINRLMRWARGHNDAATRKRPCSKFCRHCRDDYSRLRHPPGAVFAARHSAFIGTNAGHPIICKRHKIALSCGVLPHADIHRRCH